MRARGIIELMSVPTPPKMAMSSPTTQTMTRADDNRHDGPVDVVRTGVPESPRAGEKPQE